MFSNNWLRTGAIFAALAVVAGTFGAHGLKVSDEELAKLSPPVQRATLHRMENFETGNRYHMYHALGLIAVGLASASAPSRRLDAAGGLLTLGILLFSGSLYALGLGGPRALGMVAPVGGLAFIAGWIMMAAGGTRGNSERIRDRELRESGF